MSWKEFNAKQRQSFDLIPKGTLVRVRMAIKPGGYDDVGRGWTGGYATKSIETNAIYLACEFVLLEGAYARRKLRSNIGLYSPKGEAWANMGRAFIRAILNSARGVDPNNTSPHAQAARRIADFSVLDGMVFAGQIDIEKNAHGDSRNVVKQVIEPGHKDYARLMESASTSMPGNGSIDVAMLAPSVSDVTSTAPCSCTTSKPAWAQ
jgi:hypothetical protein